jgi:hypothetical protein
MGLAGTGTSRVNLPDYSDSMQAVMQGYNVLVMGLAGTGKSHVIHKIIQGLKLRDMLHQRRQTFAVTSSTGISASYIQGTTLHSLSGCGIPTCVQDFRKLWKKKREWRSLGTLILDEAFMMQPVFLDLLDVTVRGSHIVGFTGVSAVFVNKTPSERGEVLISWFSLEFRLLSSIKTTFAPHGRSAASVTGRTRHSAESS